MPKVVRLLLLLLLVLLLVSQKPPAAVEGQLTLETADSVALHDSQAHQSKLAEKSVMRTTQLDNMKLLQLKVGGQWTLVSGHWLVATGEWSLVSGH